MYGVNDVEFISVERLAHEQDMWSIAGGELLPYISHVGICRHKAYGFWVFFV